SATVSVIETSSGTSVKNCLMRPKNARILLKAPFNSRHGKVTTHSRRLSTFFILAGWSYSWPLVEGGGVMGGAALDGSAGMTAAPAAAAAGSVEGGAALDGSAGTVTVAAAG